MIDACCAFVLPVVVLALGVLAWELGRARGTRFRPTCCPGPRLVFETLVADWAVLSASLLVTLMTTLQGFVLAVVGGVGLAILFNQSRLIEYSLYPYAVILQVTPIVAIAPLLLIYLPQQARGARLRLDRRVLPGARQHHARAQLGRPQSRRPVPPLRRVALQVLCELKLPAALPYILGG